jgi:haloacetate dehalogenase
MRLWTRQTETFMDQLPRRKAAAGDNSESVLLNRRSFLMSAVSIGAAALLPRRGFAEMLASTTSADGLAHLFPGFEETWFDVGDNRLFARVGGPETAPAVLLLHGFPQSHLCWHPIAAELAKENRVICLDMKGYGLSSAPWGDAAHEDYSKRTWANEAFAVMDKLGIERFAVAGHDRGAQVGYRMAIDNPRRIERLAVLDNLPIYVVWDLINATPGFLPWWAYMAKPEPESEHILTASHIEEMVRRGSGPQSVSIFDPGVLKFYRKNWSEPARVHAYCEDYRAAAGPDLTADKADIAAGKKIACPTLILWGSKIFGGFAETPLASWRRTFAPQASGIGFDCGHFLAEEKPKETAAALVAHLLR